MRKLVVVLAAVGVALFASVASAKEPTVQRYPIDNQFVVQSCEFPVSIHATGFLLDITWVDANGNAKTIETAPQAKWELTNVNTSKVIMVNIAGPGQYYFPADGSFKLVGTGTWGWTANPDTDRPGLFVSKGRFVFSIDPAGNSSWERVGTLVDLCGVLAP